jgi:hypothetical protein
VRKFWGFNLSVTPVSLSPRTKDTDTEQNNSVGEEILLLLLIPDKRDGKHEVVKM